MKHIDCIKDIHKTLKLFQQTVDSYEISIRMAMAEFILQCMKLKKWSPKKLAKESHVSEKMIEQIVNGDTNWTVKSIAKLLLAMKIRPGKIYVD